MKNYFSFCLLFLGVFLAPEQKSKAENLENPTAAIEVVRNYYQAVELGNHAEIKELLADNCTITNPLVPFGTDKKTWTGVVLGFKVAFSNLKHQIDEYLVSGETVTVKGFLQGTNDGQLMGNAPTGKNVNTRFIAIFKLDHQFKIKSIDAQFDLKTFESQVLGADPNIVIENAKNTIRQAYDALNRHDWNAFAVLCDEKKYMDVGVAPLPIVGAKEAIEGYKQFFSAFPDLKVQINEIGTISPQRYLLRVTLTGTHKNTLMGIPATGAKLNYDDCDLIELDANGKIIYHQPTKGGKEVFRQIGINPDEKPMAKK
ncbi:MAG: ester cyclase [Saprospiraceae bacterium]|nr:ester cyclase [Saprospiraceae bacterium]